MLPARHAKRRRGKNENTEKRSSMKKTHTKRAKQLFFNDNYAKL